VFEQNYFQCDAVLREILRYSGRLNDRLYPGVDIRELLPAKHLSLECIHRPEYSLEKGEPVHE